MIVNVAKKWSARPIDSDTDRTAITEGWTVLTDSINDGPVVVLGAPGIPVEGATNPEDSQAELTQKRARPIGPLFWEVTCIYERPGGSQVNPVLLPAKINYRTVLSNEAIDADFFGNPILNRARQRTDDYPTKQISDRLLTIQRNRSAGSITLAFLEQFIDTTNSATFAGALPGTGLMRDISASYVQQTVGGFAYWDLTASIQLRKPYTTPLWMPGDNAAPSIAAGTPAAAWFLRRMNAGMDELAPTSWPKWRGIIGRDGRRVSRPVPLDANGVAIQNDFDPPIWQAWRIYGQSDFNTMGLL